LVLVVSTPKGEHQSNLETAVSTKMFNIQCEDLMMLRFSTNKLSMLFKILGVDAASLVILLGELLDKTTV